MDPDLILIFGFIIAITTVLGISINSVVAKVLAHRRWERENSLIGTQASAKSGQLEDRTDLIEDRLRVLERLATDRGQTLADEIEALRNQQPDFGTPIPQKRETELS